MVKLVCILAGCVLMQSSSIFAQGGPPVFQHRDLPESRPTPIRTVPPAKPIPRSLLIAGAAVFLLGGVILLYFASKEWRNAHIFGRKYRFPPVENAALRFGGNRSGGLMAAIESAKDKMNP